MPRSSANVSSTNNASSSVTPANAIGALRHFRSRSSYQSIMRSSATGESATPRWPTCSAIAPDSANRTSNTNRSSASDSRAAASARAKGAASGSAATPRSRSLRLVIAFSSLSRLECGEPLEQQLLLERQVADELLQMQVLDLELLRACAVGSDIVTLFPRVD